MSARGLPQQKIAIAVFGRRGVGVVSGHGCGDSMAGQRAVIHLMRGCLLCCGNCAAPDAVSSTCVDGGASFEIGGNWRSGFASERVEAAATDGNDSIHIVQCSLLSLSKGRL